MARRTKLEANLTRECLVRAASELFEKQGFRDTTVSDIVRLAGTTKGALFHHFENKEALFFEIYKRLQARMDEAARSAAREALDPGDPGRAFLVGCRAYLEWTQRPDYQRIILIDGPVVLDEICLTESARSSRCHVSSKASSSGSGACGRKAHANVAYTGPWSE